jgi:hypothetical protein
MTLGKIFFKSVIIGLVLAGLLGLSLSLVAIAQQERQAPTSKYTVLVFGKLYLKPDGDAAVAEKLLMEKLLPAAKEIQGLKITALKKLTRPDQRSDQKTSQPDFVMMAEMTDMSAFLKLLASAPGPMKEYGEQMKAQAGAPEFELYQILGTSKE